MHYYYIVTQVAAFPAAIACRYSNHTLEHIPPAHCYYTTTQTVVTRIHQIGQLFSIRAVCVSGVFVDNLSCHLRVLKRGAL
ncbi:hypothetical protein F4776DRAFT_643233 [Hypoxylon sp. NC0597]|nr:hypothetical protein F4776DRAFT_643233 [Hypoxylon sp. NC0597]